MLRRLLSTAAFSLAILPAVAGAQLYNNGAPNATDGNEMTQWIQAEDFSLASSATITGIRFWGFQLADAPGYAGSITWQIYTNSAAHPGTVLFSGSASPVGVAQGNNTATGDTQRQFDFATNFTLSAGTYWLGLHNGALATTDRRDFYWQSTTPNSTALGMEDETPFDGVFVTNGVEHAFQLYGGQGTPTVVPEPSTYALMTCGLVVVGFARRRRRA
jgi:hypothetical protein